MVHAVGALQREIKQRRPFKSRRQEGIVGLLRTTDRIRRRLAEGIEPHGVTLQQYNVLRILRGAGEEGLPTLEIGERMVEHAPGVTRLIDRLERKRLVARRRCPRDRRQVLCVIAPAGLRLLDTLEPVVDLADRRCLGMLRARELGQLIRLLDRIRGGLSRHAAAQPSSGTS